MTRYNDNIPGGAIRSVIEPVFKYPVQPCNADNVVTCSPFLRAWIAEYQVVGDSHFNVLIADLSTFGSTWYSRGIWMLYFRSWKETWSNMWSCTAVSTQKCNLPKRQAAVASSNIVPTTIFHSPHLALWCLCWCCPFAGRCSGHC